MELLVMPLCLTQLSIAGSAMEKKNICNYELPINVRRTKERYMTLGWMW